MTARKSAQAPLHRHVQFVVSACIGAVALAVALYFRISIAHSVAANVFFICYIFVVLWQMPLLTADYLSKHANATDEPVGVIFGVTIVVVGVATFSLFQLINSKQSPDVAGLVFSLLSLPLGWFTLQAMTALHYAHVYWMDGDESRSKKNAPAGGLEFPSKNRPDGWDFLYFAATIGMTFQTSDTQVTTTHMRGIVLMHAVFSFFFNTVIVAAAVNLAVSLGAG